MPEFFLPVRFEFMVKCPKIPHFYPIFTEKMTALSITKMKYTINFQTMPFIVHNKTNCF